MSTKFVVRDQTPKEPDTVVNFWLEPEKDGICLMGQAPGGSDYAILTIKPGRIYANICVDPRLALPLDSDGRVIVSTS